MDFLANPSQWIMQEHVVYLKEGRFRAPLPLTIKLILQELFKLPRPQFPHLYNRDNNISLKVVIWFK